ncbi:sulfotransferase family 2 domain-containing protein [Nitrosomonas sp. Is37]|uniref:sulfotransferase family 2 domain-containing protein n=1 Tax=Nitrosomonas sp. Is37 TaxID=3080535 RepID=UPI00294B6AA8|nr:sulfotransferase family 2 domain-containing protein [Nitrosomonas sp. Is37]MDV6344318.1 sulfotransferase family 2 domain-containing protein [Nitrosomonas sp. Is37]
MKIIFLHIPKTAGQSIHAALVNAFGKEAVCPARVNDQLRQFSIAELNRYQVFSGHLDWSLLDCIKGPKYVFTVLREPMDRILSFYFYTRNQGENLSAEERVKPERQGIKAAFELNPREYFLGGPPHLRNFIDDHYDNFYSYYFAGRRYRCRGELAGLINRKEFSQADIVRMAMDNLSTLDDVFTVSDMASVFRAIQEISGVSISESEAEQYRVNVNTKVAARDRLDGLKALGADEVTLKRLQDYCTMDNKIWALYNVNVYSHKESS